MSVIFAFDPGTHAIGWAVLADAGDMPMTCGAHLFAIAAPGAEALAARFEAARHRRRRRARLARVRRALADFGLIPDSRDGRRSFFAIDPYAARLRGLTHELDDAWFGRALLHLACRRGVPGRNSATPGPPRLPIECLDTASRRLRPGIDPARTPLFTRADIVAEFQALWARQAEPRGLTATERDQFAAIAFADPPARRPPARQARDPHVAIPVREATRLLDRLTRSYGVPDEILIEAPLAKEPRKSPERGRARREAVFARMAGPDGVALCPYSGTPFSRADLETGLFEIDHVVPLARGGAPDLANEVLCLASANRAKGMDMPGPDISARRRPRASRAGRQPGGFCLRQSRDLARIVARLTILFGRRAPVRLIAPPFAPADRLKDRRDHRHHALDAAALLAATRPGTPLPATDTLLATAQLSLHVDRRPRGMMHEETIHRIRERDGGQEISVRKPVSGLGRLDAARFASASRHHGREADRGLARHVRITRPAATAIILPPNRRGAPQRAVFPALNHHLDIVSLRDGRWRAFAATLHDRLQPGWRPEWERQRIGGRLVMRLCRNDVIALHASQDTVLLRIVRIVASRGLVWAADLAAAGDLAARHADPSDPFRFRFLSANALQEGKASAIRHGPGDTGPGSLQVTVRSGTRRNGPRRPERDGRTATDSFCRPARRP